MICALGSSGRRVAAHRLHLTLAFFGHADDGRIERLCAHAAQIRVPPFALQLDRIGYFVRPRILWLGPSVVPAPLAALAEAVRAMDDAPDHNKTFRPHITLARDASPVSDRARIAPIAWPVTRFSLVQSGADGAPGAYSQLDQWRLL